MSPTPHLHHHHHGPGQDHAPGGCGCQGGGRCADCPCRRASQGQSPAPGGEASPPETTGREGR